MIGTLEIVRTTLAVEYPLLSTAHTSKYILRDIFSDRDRNPWKENPVLRKLKFISSADLIECLTILAEGK